MAKSSFGKFWGVSTSTHDRLNRKEVGSDSHLKQVYTSEDRLMIYHYKNLLELEGIKCMVKNDSLSAVVGEIPMLVAWPELWVIDSDMEGWAKELIQRSQKNAEQGEIWTCEFCGEEHAAQFSDCWNCQSIKAF